MNRVCTRIVGLVIASISLVGCQTTLETPTVSIEEAKKTVAQFESGETLLPPRAADDVLGLFDNWPDDRSSSRSEWIVIADREIPGDVRAHTQITSLYERASAARRLGRSGQELEDLQKAAALIEVGRSNGSELVGPIFEKFVYRDAAWAEFFDGSFQSSVELFRHSAHIDQGTSVFEIDLGGWTSLSGLAYVQAYSGDLEQAEKAAEQALETIEEAGRRPKSASAVAVGGRHRFNPWRRIYASAIRYSLLQAEGRWREAEPHIRNAVEVFETEFGGRGHLAWAHGRQDDWLDIQRAQLAANLVRQGRMNDAELVLRDALRDALEEQGKYSKSTAIVLSRFHDVLAAQGRYQEAEVLARRVLDIYGTLRAPSGSRLVGEVQFQLGQALALQGRWQDARSVYQLALDAFEPGAYSFRRYFANDPSMLLTLLEAGALDAVAPLLSAARERSVDNKGAAHYDSLELAGLEAMLAAKQGDQSTALQRYRAVVPELIAADRQARISGSQRYDRRWRLLEILEYYIGTLERAARTVQDRQAARDHAFEAFRIAAFAQSHDVDWALAGSAARNKANDPELAELIRAEQDAKLQIDSLTARLSDALSQPSGQQNKTAIASLRTRLERLAQSRITFRFEIESRFSNYTRLIAPQPPTAAEVQGIISPDEALLSFFVGNDQTYVWAIPGAGEPVFAAVELGRRQLAQMVDRLRGALDPSPSPKTLGDIPEFDVGMAHELFRTLYEPVATGWQDAKSLLVVPHGALAYLPPSLLVVRETVLPLEETLLFQRYRRVPWLGRSYAITLLPSVTSLSTLRDSKRAAGGDQRPFIGFGDPFFNRTQMGEPGPSLASASRSGGGLVLRHPIALRSSPKTRRAASADISRLPRLPETADEVRSIARSMGAASDGTVYLGAEASEERVKSEDLSQYRVVAFATHGLMAGDLDGLLQPALALSSPEVTGGPEDGLLTMGEVLNLKMRADWVVLSACNTGAGNGAGARAVSGLGRAFFYAGTRSLLVSNWPVHSEATKVIMSDLFRRWATEAALGKAEAQRQAMMALIDEGVYRDATGREVFSYAHPIFWAPFTIVGDSNDDPIS